MHDPGKTFTAIHPTTPGEVICDDYCWKSWEAAGWAKKKPDPKAEKPETPPKK